MISSLAYELLKIMYMNEKTFKELVHTIFFKVTYVTLDNRNLVLIKSLMVIKNYVFFFTPTINSPFILATIVILYEY